MKRRSEKTDLFHASLGVPFLLKRHYLQRKQTGYDAFIPRR